MLDDVTVRVALHREWTSHTPFVDQDVRTSFEPDRVALETSRGRVIEERLDPRASFAGHSMDTPWDRLHLAYFVGYAMWTESERLLAVIVVDAADAPQLTIPGPR